VTGTSTRTDYGVIVIHATGATITDETVPKNRPRKMASNQLIVAYHDHLAGTCQAGCLWIFGERVGEGMVTTLAPFPSR